MLSDCAQQLGQTGRASNRPLFPATQCSKEAEKSRNDRYDMAIQAGGNLMRFSLAKDEKHTKSADRAILCRNLQPFYKTRSTVAQLRNVGT